MEADRTWKALGVDSVKRKTHNRAIAQLSKKAIGVDSVNSKRLRYEDDM